MRRLGTLYNEETPRAEHHKIVAVRMLPGLHLEGQYVKSDIILPLWHCIQT